MGPERSEGGINEDIDMLKPAIAKMCSMQHGLDEVQIKALGAITLKLFKEYGQDLTITGLRDAFVDGTIRELGLGQGSAHQGSGGHAQPLHEGRRVRPVLRGAQHHRFLQRVHGDRERGAEAQARSARRGEHPPHVPDHGRDVPDPQTARRSS